MATSPTTSTSKQNQSDSDMDSGTDSTTESTTERHEIDPIFKQRIEDEFRVFIAASQTVYCETEYEVGRLPRKIDVLITVQDKQERQTLCRETPFFYLQTHNHLEFKGRNDTLTQDGYHTIRGRKEFLSARPEVDPSKMTVTIVSAGKPVSVFTYAKDTLKRPFVKTRRRGYYKTKETPPIYLIVINELPIIKKNYPLLLFASSKQVFLQFLERIIAEDNHTYMWYALKVRPQLTTEVLRMAGIPSSMTREDLEFLAEELGPDLVSVISLDDIFMGMNREKQQRFLFSANIQDILSGTSPAERLRLTLDMMTGTNKEERLYLTDELFRNLADDIQQTPTFHRTLEAREQLSVQRAKQQILRRALRRKFGDVPDNVVQVIEHTTDADQLDAWMDELFDVDTLGEMDFNLNVDGASE